MNRKDIDRLALPALQGDFRLDSTATNARTLGRYRDALRTGRILVYSGDSELAAPGVEGSNTEDGRDLELTVPHATVARCEPSNHSLRSWG